MCPQSESAGPQDDEQGRPVIRDCYHQSSVSHPAPEEQDWFCSIYSAQPVSPPINGAALVRAAAASMFSAAQKHLVEKVRVTGHGAFRADCRGNQAAV